MSPVSYDVIGVAISRRSPLAAVCVARIARPRPHLGVYVTYKIAGTAEISARQAIGMARPAQSFTYRRHEAALLTDPVLRSTDISGGLRRITRWGTEGGDAR